MATKRHLVKALEEKYDYLSTQDIRSAVDCVLNYMENELSKGNRIEIRGFGSLAIRKRKYANKNAEYNTIYYRMSKNIQDILNGS